MCLRKSGIPRLYLLCRHSIPSPAPLAWLPNWEIQVWEITPARAWFPSSLSSKSPVTFSSLSTLSNDYFGLCHGPELFRLKNKKLQIGHSVTATSCLSSVLILNSFLPLNIPTPPASLLMSPLWAGSQFAILIIYINILKLPYPFAFLSYSPNKI